MAYAPGKIRRATSGAPANSAAPSAAASRAEAERVMRNLSSATPTESAAPAPLPSQAATVEAHWFGRLKHRLFGDEGASWGVSLLVHLVILAIFAIPVIRHATRNEPIIATVVAEAAGGGSQFGLPEMVNTELAPPLPLANAPSQTAVPIQATNETLAVSKALFGTPDGDGGQGTGKGSGIGPGDVGHGMMQFVPKNAVRAGSFAAWTTPGFGNSYVRKFGEPDPQPGDSPRPGQPYLITIQIKVPGDRRTFPIRDLSGEIVGTDGYRQVLPKDTYQLGDDGELVPLFNKRSVRVVDGVVQFVVRVPGAQNLVKDTIVIESKLLKEEQKLELVFKSNDEVGDEQ